ncbi:MAG: MrpF/PhaF family protein [Chloroflexia bacterium]
MNVWIFFAIILLVGMIPCGIVCTRGEPMSRLVGLEMASTMAVLALVLLGKGLERDFLYDLAIAQALLSFGGALVFIRFFERWL